MGRGGRRCFTSFARDFDISHFDILKDEQKKRPDFDRPQALEERLLRFCADAGSQTIGIPACSLGNFDRRELRGG